MTTAKTMPSATTQAKAAILFAVGGIIVNAVSNFLLQQVVGAWITVVAVIQFIAVPALAITAIAIASIVIRAAIREGHKEGKAMAIVAVVLAALVLVPWALLSVLYLVEHSQA